MARRSQVGGLGVLVLGPALALSGAAGCGGSEATEGGGGEGGAGGAGATAAATGGTAGTGGAVATGGTSPGTGGAAAGAPGMGGAPAGGAPDDAGIVPPPPGSRTYAECFADISDGPVQIDYDQFGPVINSACSGTNHQDIQGVERLVFLGDSITTGTPPTPPDQFYTALVTAAVQAKFGAVAMQNCSAWGARNDDLLPQMAQCFPAPEAQKTLVIFTSGGNDLKNIASSKLEGDPAIAEVDAMLQKLRDAIAWLQDPVNFPNGSYVVFADVYEYTDTSTDMSSCPLASIAAGLSGTWLAGRDVVKHMNEGYAKIAVETGTDMIFLQETFCGHGYHASDPALQCYRGPNAEVWFDVTCIHPTPSGHAQVARLFSDVVNE